MQRAISYLNRVTKRRTVAFIISDFYAPDFKSLLSAANKRHDVVAVTITDPLELELPEAGLVRLGIEPAPLVVHYFDVGAFVPAPGQGALAVQVRRPDGAAAGQELAQAVAVIHDGQTARRVEAERRVLAGLEGGCNLPLGVHAVIEENEIYLVAALCQDDGSMVRAEARCAMPAEAAEQVLAQLTRE